MSGYAELSTAGILEVFTEEVVQRHGGRVSDAFDDGRRLFARSILPRTKALRRGDKVQGGVALRANEQEVWLHPYLFRQVCRNGAIVAQTVSTRHFEDLHVLHADGAKEFLREAVAACCADEAFEGAVLGMRASMSNDVEMALNLLPMLPQLSGGAHAGLLSAIMDRFFHDGDRSRFGLINAITATARDTRDPELRWNLEELGGGMAVGVLPDVPRHPEAARAQPSEALSVG